MLNVHVVVHCRLGDQASSLTLSYNVFFSCTALELQLTLLPFIQSCMVLSCPFHPHHSSHFKCFAFYILTTNYYCSLYNNILYLLLVMNKRHSFIRLIQIKKELSRCYSYLTKSWHKVINKNSIDNFFF